MKEYAVGDIRNKVAEVLDEALNNPVRVVTLRATNGERRPPLVILSESEYKKLKGSK